MSVCVRFLSGAGNAATDADKSPRVPPAPATNAPRELLEEGLQPHQVGQVFVSSTVEPNTWIDITGTIDLKIEALRQHVSQFPNGQVPEELLREWAVECGKSAGLAYAEAFRRIVLAVGLTVEGLEEQP